MVWTWTDIPMGRCAPRALLRLRHDGWQDADASQRGGFDGGWHDKLTKDYLESLRLLCVTGAGKPFQVPQS